MRYLLPPQHVRPRAAGATLLAGVVALAAGAAQTAAAPAPTAPTAPAPAPAARIVLSPFAGTPAALPRTQISFLGAPARELTHISVVGSISGRHSGRLRSYSSAVGASFVPARPFAPGERVTVHASLRTPRGTRRLTTGFTVGRPVSVSQAEFVTSPGTPADVQSFYSQPAMHPPTVTVTIPAGEVSGGLLFATPALGPGQHGPMIFDNEGQLVWFRSMPSGEDAANLRVQTYAGAPALTWWQGRTIALGYGEGEDVIASSAYRTVAVVRAGNGLLADEHEFLLTSRGQAYITAFSPVRASLAEAGGARHGIVLDGVVQEIDVATGLVMWEWHSLGHVPLSDSYSAAPRSSTTPYDYFHPNSVYVTSAGNLIVSARNTWTVYAIARAGGRVIWRLGGRRSTFALGAGVHFAWQHDAQLLPDGELSLFDDEGVPQEKPPPRGEIVRLDLATHRASLVRQFLPAQRGLLTTSQGDLQTLPNGDWLVGYGGSPELTEFTGRGKVVFSAQLPPNEASYRVYREPWSGQPAQPPAVAATTTGATTNVYASWNGATDVAAWQLLSGPSPTALSPVSVTPANGFETQITAPAAAYVQVRPLAADDAPLAASPVIAPSAAAARRA